MIYFSNDLIGLFNDQVHKTKKIGYHKNLEIVHFITPKLLHIYSSRTHNC